MNNNPYRVLGVPDGASIEECTNAYKQLAKKYHPDLNPDNAFAAEKMAQINAAYDEIKNGTAAEIPFYREYVYTQRKSNSGCLLRLLKIIFVIALIRLIILLAASFFGSTERRSIRKNETAAEEYSQQTTENNAADYFGTDNGESPLFN